jgi:hypothetical protein
MRHLHVEQDHREVLPLTNVQRVGARACRDDRMLKTFQHPAEQHEVIDIVVDNQNRGFSPSLMSRIGAARGSRPFFIAADRHGSKARSKFCARVQGPRKLSARSCLLSNKPENLQAEIAGAMRHAGCRGADCRTEPHFKFRSASKSEQLD